MFFNKKFKQLKKDYKKLEKENERLKAKLDNVSKIRKKNIENLKLKRKVKKLQKYVVENPKNVENYKIFRGSYIFMSIVTVILVFFIIRICYFTTMSTDHRKFILPLFITLATIILVNSVENIMSMIEKIFKPKHISINDRKLNLTTIKFAGNILLALFVLFTMFSYDNVPLYKVNVNPDKYKLEYLYPDNHKIKMKDLTNDKNDKGTLKDHLDKYNYHIKITEKKDD